jgi:flagellar motility protein MotE (MotC chaperone)
MLRAIEQRNTELDQKAKQLALKEYRLRILEQEVSENLKKTKGFRDEMAKMRAEQKAAEAKREADLKAAARAAEVKRLAEERVAAVRKEEEKKAAKAALVVDQRTSEERALAAKKVEEEEELLRQKEEERKALQTQQFSKLAKIYETMPAEDAALRLQNMKDDFALAIIPLMKDKKASKVLSVMDPIVAAKYTEKMGMRELSNLTASPGKKNRR